MVKNSSRKNMISMLVKYVKLGLEKHPTVTQTQNSFMNPEIFQINQGNQRYKFTINSNWLVVVDRIHLKPSNASEQEKQDSPVWQSASDEHSSPSCSKKEQH